MLQPSKNRNLTFWVTVATSIFGVVVVTFALYVYSEKNVERVSNLRLNALQLADELRHSSESLTKMARSYIVTGNPDYKRYFQEIIDIREGRRPRPANHLYYWDLVVYGDQFPQDKAADAVPLLDLVKGAAFGENEFSLLADAKRNSDALAQTEMEAIRLFDSTAADPTADKQRARQILFDKAYDQAKLNILRPISQFNDLMDARTAAAVERAIFHANVFRVIFVGTSLFWLYLLWRSYRSLLTLLGASPGELQTQIARLGRGDFSPPAVAVPVDADSVMAWLNETRHELNSLSTARLRAEALLEERTRYLWTNNRILQMLADNAPLETILSELMRIMENIHPGALCSVLLVNEAGTHLCNAASPSLPESWRQITAKVPIGDSIGSCGTAAFRGERVVVEDVRTHAYWRPFRDVAEQAGLRACWSQPFKNSQGKVLGTFAVYHREPARPTEQEIQLIEDYAKLAQLAVERASLAEGLRQSQEMYRLIAENSSEVIWLVDLPEMRFSYINHAIKHLRGWAPEEILNQPLSAMLTPKMEAKVKKTLEGIVARLGAPGQTVRHETLEVELPHKDGHMAPAELIATLLLDEAGRPRQLLGISRDITERKAAEQAIRQMAFHDPLTTLPNQRLLEDRLHQVIARAQRDHSRMSLLFIDLDKFKQVNDMRGHATGDWLLQRVAERMQNCLRESDTAARIGGDEFVVLLPDAETAQSALAVAEKIRATLEEPFVTPDGAALHISSSIGIAIYPDHADTPRDLLRFGDEAMYRAKKGGRNAVEVFAAAAPAQNSRPVIRVMWQPAYACGEPSIDEEHKELFRRANTLLDLAVKHEADPPAVNQAFDELLAHVTAHFAHEEAVLRDHDYEALSRHADQHRVLLEHAQDLRRQAAEGMLPVGELIDFIASKVVVGHMLKEDSRFHGLFTHAPRPNRSRNRTV